MNQIHITAALASIACLALPAAAQIAPGEGLMTAIGGVTPGLAIFDVPGTGNMTLVGGVPIQVPAFNSGVIDPVTGELWLVGHGMTSHQILRVSLSDSTASSFSSFADLSGQPGASGGQEGLAGIDLDRDGNLFVCDEANIWKVDRSSGAITHWASGTTSFLNDLTIDRETNTMWSVELEGFTPGAEIRTFDIDAGPSVGTQLLDLTTVPFETSASAITFDGKRTLYVGTWGSVFGVDINTGLTKGLNVAGGGAG